MKSLFLVIVYLLFIFCFINFFDLDLGLGLKENYKSKGDSVNKNIDILNKLLVKRNIEKLDNIKI